MLIFILLILLLLSNESFDIAGLFTIYLVNTVLAVFATFKANERGQSALLWGVKTFSVGGLVFDQFTQLPTLKEVQELENIKGARAVKKK